jgi:hypothetical protein
MGREFIGDCSGDPEFGEYETDLIIKYLKQVCGPPPRGVDIQVTWEGCEVGDEGEEAQYPVISVVWDDFAVPYPYDYIEKCGSAFEQFDLPQEIHDRIKAFIDLQERIQKLFDPDSHS